jgi:hypothetical protein
MSKTVNAFLMGASLMHSWKLEAEAKPGIGYRRMICTKCGICMKQTKSEICPGQGKTQKS